MSTDTEFYNSPDIGLSLSKFLEEYSGLKKQNQEQVELIKKLRQDQYQQMAMQNEREILKKDNQRLLENNNYLNDQLNQLKELYAETKSELQESFHFIQSMNGVDYKEKQILEKLFEIFSVTNCEQLLATAEKIKSVMLGIQHLEQFCRSICQVIYEENEQNYDLDQVVPIIQKLKSDQKYVECFIHFKQQLESCLCMNNSTDQQILDKIRNQQHNQEIQNLKTLFKIGHEDNFMFKMNQIFILLQDIQQFIKISKRLLELDENMKNEQCMIQILKTIEKLKQPGDHEQILIKIMKLLHVDNYSQIINRIEQLTEN